jgi:hypothetical protein
MAEVAKRLSENLNAKYFVDRVPQIQADAKAIATAYAEHYGALHTQRTQTYQTAIEEIKGYSEWMSIPLEQQEALLRECTKRACVHDLSAVDNWSLTTNERPLCQANIAQMESDLAALTGLKSLVLVRIQELMAQIGQKVTIERVRLVDFSSAPIDSEEAVEQVVERLKKHLLTLIGKGIKIILE